MIVDSDRAFTQALGEQLALSGEYSCLYADDITSALEILRDQVVDLALLNGADLLRQMRADGFSLPVIVISGADDAEGDPGDEPGPCPRR